MIYNNTKKMYLTWSENVMHSTYVGEVPSAPSKYALAQVRPVDVIIIGQILCIKCRVYRKRCLFLKPFARKDFAKSRHVQGSGCEQTFWHTKMCTIRLNHHQKFPNTSLEKLEETRDQSTRCSLAFIDCSVTVFKQYFLFL